MSGYILPLRLCWLLLLSLSAVGAQAHEASYSVIRFDRYQNSLAVDIRMPADQLALALSHGVSSEAPVDGFSGNVLRAYVSEHLQLLQQQTPLVLLWAGTEAGVDTQSGVDVPVQVVHLQAKVAAGDYTLHTDLIVHQVVSHRLHVIAGADFAAGQTAPVNVGLIRLKRYDLNVSQNEGSRWQSALAMLQLGLVHIAGGTDHLLFLLCLLLTLPLALSQDGKRHWQLPLLARVSAFTAAHSLTLLLAVLNWLPAGAAWNEVLVAASVMMAAVLVICPLPRLSPVSVAAAFGLVHGLAFAEVFSGLGLQGWDLATALAAFTLGIEAAQLLFVGLLLPLLLWCSRWQKFYRLMTLVAAAGILQLAFYWLIVRCVQVFSPAAEFPWFQLLTLSGLVSFLVIVLYFSFPWRRSGIQF